jgi:hypothetical protein
MMKTYIGGCHCGAVKYSVDLDIKDVISCNCSICSKTGGLLAFAGKDNFRLLSGEKASSDYQFAKKRIHHLFCKTCGIKSYGQGKAPDGTEMYAVNIRCLDDIDVDVIPVKKYDGKSL